MEAICFWFIFYTGPLTSVVAAITLQTVSGRYAQSCTDSGTADVESAPSIFSNGVDIVMNEPQLGEI